MASICRLFASKYVNTATWRTAATMASIIPAFSSEFKRSGSGFDCGRISTAAAGDGDEASCGDPCRLDGEGLGEEALRKCVWFSGEEGTIEGEEDGWEPEFWEAWGIRMLTPSAVSSAAEESERREWIAKSRITSMKLILRLCCSRRQQQQQHSCSSIPAPLSCRSGSSSAPTLFWSDPRSTAWCSAIPAGDHNVHYKSLQDQLEQEKAAAAAATKAMALSLDHHLFQKRKTEKKKRKSPLISPPLSSSQRDLSYTSLLRASSSSYSSSSSLIKFFHHFGLKSTGSRENSASKFSGNSTILTNENLFFSIEKTSRGLSGDSFGSRREVPCCTRLVFLRRTPSFFPCPTEPVFSSSSPRPPSPSPTRIDFHPVTDFCFLRARWIHPNSFHAQLSVEQKP